MKCENKFAIDDNGNIADWDSKDALFRGIIDNWNMSEDCDNEVNISDYYTGRKDVSPFVKSEQLTIYTAALMLQNKDIEYANCCIDFIRPNQTSEFIVTKQEAMIAIKEIKALDSHYATLTEYKAEPGEFCGYCEYWRDCPKMKDAIGRLPSVEDDAETLLLIDKARDEIRERLKASIAKHESITVGDSVIGYHQDSSESYDYGSVMSHLARWSNRNHISDDTREIAEKNIKTIAKTKVEKIVRQINNLEKLENKLDISDLSKYKIVTQKSKFGFRSEDKASIDVLGGDDF